MSEERLSDKMSAKSDAVTDAFEVLNDAVIDAMNFNFDAGMQCEQERIIKLLIDLDAIRRDALGHLVAFNTHGTEVIYLPELEQK